MSSLAKSYYTPEEYLVLERKAEYKSEYLNGQIFAMSGASREHILISVNLVRELSSQLRGRPCEVYNGDMRVKVNPTGLYTYPDVTVVCGEPHFDDKHTDTLVNPTLIIEVLSPSTEAYDRGEKFAHYRKLPSLTDYVLVAQDQVRVEHYVRYLWPVDGSDMDYAGHRRGTHDQWMLAELSDLDGHDATLQLTSIGCNLLLRDIYERVGFASDSAGAGAAETEAT